MKCTLRKIEYIDAQIECAKKLPTSVQKYRKYHGGKLKYEAQLNFD